MQAEHLPYVHADQHGVAFLPDGRLLIGNDGGAFTLTPESNEAVDHSEGLAIAQTYRIDMDLLAMDRLIAGTWWTTAPSSNTMVNGEHVLAVMDSTAPFSEVEDIVYASLCITDRSSGRTTGAMPLWKLPATSEAASTRKAPGRPLGR